MARINVKPLSVNRAWKGRKFKTQDYKDYEKECFAVLPKMELDFDPTEIHLKFGVSNMGFDFDNGIKPFVDILQKKYGFNDRTIRHASIEKVKVAKGEEFIDFELS